MYYILYGSEAVEAHENNDGPEHIAKIITNSGGALHKYKNVDDPLKAINDFSGWNDFVQLEEVEYIAIKKELANLGHNEDQE